jgi:hypothetical protein
MTDPITNESIEKIFHSYQGRLKFASNEEQKDGLILEKLYTAYDAGRGRGTLAHPRYTRIDIEGREGHFAVFNRKPQSEFVDVEILTPEIFLESSLPINDYEQQLIGARHIFEQLEGYRPIKSTLDLYMRPFEHLTGHYNRGDQ